MFELDAQPLEILLEQMERLKRLIEEERENVEAMEEVVAGLKAQQERHEFHLQQIESVLGKTPQIQLEHSSLLLRGQKISEVAVEVLTAERGEDAEVHYKEWYALMRACGHVIAGKDPVNTFLTQINRSPQVQRIGSRTGRYRLAENEHTPQGETKVRTSTL